MEIDLKSYCSTLVEYEEEDGELKTISFGKAINVLEDMIRLAE